MRGRVKNVVDFGAFVDIGVDVDGLLHISALRGAHDAMRSGGTQQSGDGDGATLLPSVGDVLALRVVSVDSKRRRIGLALDV